MSRMVDAGKFGSAFVAAFVKMQFILDMAESSLLHSILDDATPPRVVRSVIHTKHERPKRRSRN